LAAGFLVGAVTGTVAFRRASKRNFVIVLGLVVALGLAIAWHGPVGAASRFSNVVERSARATLDDLEMAKIQAHLHHDPLTRHLILAGPADDFQTSELARLMSQLPGVSRAQWAETPAGTPLILDGAGVAALGFLVGLLLAYLFELRRRYNSQWNW
jgi:hypothetical protein